MPKITDFQVKDEQHVRRSIEEANKIQLYLFGKRVEEEVSFNLLPIGKCHGTEQLLKLV